MQSVVLPRHFGAALPVVGRMRGHGMASGVTSSHTEFTRRWACSVGDACAGFLRVRRGGGTGRDPCRDPTRERAAALVMRETRFVRGDPWRQSNTQRGK